MKKIIFLSINEIHEEYGISKDHLELFICEEWISPFNQEEMLFDAEDIARINLICEIREDLGVNDEAVPIILNLLDQIHFLRMKGSSDS